MKYIGDGFFSESGRKEAQRIILSHSNLFNYFEKLIASLRSFSSRQELEEQDSDEYRQKAIALVLAARVLEISDAALLIMKNGMSNEANTLFRVFLDAYFVLANVCNDASFIPVYFKSDQVARLKLLNAANKHSSELFEKINKYGTQEENDRLKREIEADKIQKFDSFANAERIGCQQIYDSMYRVSSASLHTTPRALEKYVEKNDDGEILSIKDYPLEDDIPQRLLDFSSFLIKLISGMHEVFGSLDQVKIDEMTAELEKMVNIKAV